MSIETSVATIVGAIVIAILLAPLRKLRHEFIVPLKNGRATPPAEPGETQS